MGRKPQVVEAQVAAAREAQAAGEALRRQEERNWAFFNRCRHAAVEGCDVTAQVVDPAFGMFMSLRRVIDMAPVVETASGIRLPRGPVPSVVRAPAGAVAPVRMVGSGRIEPVYRTTGA